MPVIFEISQTEPLRLDHTDCFGDGCSAERIGINTRSRSLGPERKASKGRGFTKISGSDFYLFMEQHGIIFGLVDS